MTVPAQVATKTRIAYACCSLCQWESYRPDAILLRAEAHHAAAGPGHKVTVVETVTTTYEAAT